MQLQLLQEELDKRSWQEEEIMDTNLASHTLTPRGQGTCADIESEGGVGFSNSDLHHNICSYPPSGTSSNSGGGAPPVAQFDGTALQQSVGGGDISELYLYSNHSRRVPEVAYSCN